MYSDGPASRAKRNEVPAISWKLARRRSCDRRLTPATSVSLSSGRSCEAKSAMLIARPRPETSPATARPSRARPLRRHTHTKNRSDAPVTSTLPGLPNKERCSWSAEHSSYNAVELSRCSSALATWGFYPSSWDRDGSLGRGEGRRVCVSTRRRWCSGGRGAVVGRGRASACVRRSIGVVGGEVV